MLECSADPAKHCQGVAFVVGVLQTANHGSGSADEFAQLSLREARLGPQFYDFASDLFVRPGFFQSFDSLRLALEVAVIEDTSPP